MPLDDQGRVLLIGKLRDRVRLASERHTPFNVSPKTVLERQQCEELLRPLAFASDKLGLPARHG